MPPARSMTSQYSSKKSSMARQCTVVWWSEVLMSAQVRLHAARAWNPLSTSGPACAALTREAIWYASGSSFCEGTAVSAAASAAFAPASAPSANQSCTRRNTAAVSCASPASRHLREAPARRLRARRAAGRLSRALASSACQRAHDVAYAHVPCSTLRVNDGSAAGRVEHGKACTKEAGLSGIGKDQYGRIRLPAPRSSPPECSGGRACRA